MNVSVHMKDSELLYYVSLKYLERIYSVLVFVENHTRKDWRTM